MAATGVLTYSSTGLAGIFCGRNFLDYSVFAGSFGQKLGIFLVELGVGMTVFSAMLIIYFSFALRRKK
jgi:multicomponent Na+:H+ antiporter subunit B